MTKLHVKDGWADQTPFPAYFYLTSPVRIRDLAPEATQRNDKARRRLQSPRASTYREESGEEAKVDNWDKKKRGRG
jgi:hypothetical protein